MFILIEMRKERKNKQHHPETAEKKQYNTCKKLR